MPTLGTSILSKVIRKILQLRNRRRLRNKDFSLITNTCLGGIWYHDLGLKFLSPTINLFINNDEFLVFVSHLRYYLSLPVECVCESNEKFPIGVINGDYGAVYLNFMHYPSFEEAQAKWYERRERVNYENIFIAMDGDTCSLQQIRQFSKLPFKHKMIFTITSMPEITCSFPLNCISNYKAGRLLEYDRICRASRCCDAFDYVSFLNRI